MINFRKIGIILAGLLLILVLILLLVRYYTSGTLEVTSNPSGATITINKSKFKTPGNIRLKRGDYTVNALLENYPPQSKTVTIEARKKTLLSFNLTQTSGAEQKPLEFSADDPIFTTQDHFSVHLPEGTEADNYDLVITLFATLNAGVNGPPVEEQLATYNAELKAYKAEALKWLKDHNVDPALYRIKWIPPDAANI